MNETLSAACDTSKNLSKSPIFILEITLHLLLAPIGCMLNLGLIYCISKSILFNNNLRLLLGHLSAMAVWFNVADFGKNIYMAFSMSVDPCWLVTTYYQCKVQELVYILPLITMLYSLVAIGVERLYATFFYTTYDFTKKMYLSISLICCLWCTALYLQLSPLPNIPEGMIIAVCQNLLVMNPKAALSLLLFGIILEIVSVLLFASTTCWDRIKLRKLMINQAQHTLAARFQLAQNVDVNKVMLPSALLHLACFIPINSFPMTVLSGWETNFETKMQFVHGSLILVDIFTILHAIIIFRKNDRLRQQLGLAFPRCNRFFVNAKVVPTPTEYGSVNQTIRHFEFLESAWNCQSTENFGKIINSKKTQYKIS